MTYLIIPTAEHLINKQEKGFLILSKKEWSKLMIKFAKLHVKAALEAAAKKVPDCEECHTKEPYEVEKDILNAYPLENII